VTVKILQVGLGVRGAHWTTILRDYPGATCVAFVDPDRAALEKARRVAGEGPRYFTELNQALAEVRADAVLIASPSPLHAEHALQALEAGLAVMVEKPFTLVVEDARRVLARAEAAGRPVVVAENYRYWQAERTVRKLVQDGLIGRPDSAQLVNRRPMPKATEGPWLGMMEFRQLQEIAIHHFDSLRSFFGLRPTSIAASAWNSPWSDYAHGVNTEALVDFEGLRVQYLGTMSSHRFSFSLLIEGEQGMIWTNRKYVFWRPAGRRFFRPVRLVKVPRGDEAPYPRAGTTSLLNGLCGAVLHGKTPETNGRDNIWNVAMVEAAQLSHGEGRRVRIAEVYHPDAAAT
jgi:predicted dehydrogenase